MKIGWAEVLLAGGIGLVLLLVVMKKFPTDKQFQSFFYPPGPPPRHVGVHPSAMGPHPSQVPLSQPV